MARWPLGVGQWSHGHMITWSQARSDNSAVSELNDNLRPCTVNTTSKSAVALGDTVRSSSLTKIKPNRLQAISWKKIKWKRWRWALALEHSTCLMELYMLSVCLLVFSFFKSRQNNLFIQHIQEQIGSLPYSPPHFLATTNSFCLPLSPWHV